MVERKEVLVPVKADVWSMDKKGNKILLKNVPAERNRKRKITRVDIDEVIRRTKAYEQVKKCRVCGCTDDQACKGGCYWVEPDLCSRCVEKRHPRRMKQKCAPLFPIPKGDPI